MNGARGGIEDICYIIGLIDKSSVRIMGDTRKITQSKIVPAVRFRFPQKIASHDAVHTIISPRLASDLIGLRRLLAPVSTTQDFQSSG